jgi:hypothetical protein
VRFSLRLLTAALVLGALGLTACGKQTKAAAEVPGVEIVRIESAGHTLGTVDYGRDVPAGGDHSPVPLICGFYPDPVPNENAVHSIEHGAIWIAFDPHLSSTDRAAIKHVVLTQDKVFASPVPGIKNPIVVTVWGRQLRPASIDDPSVASFITTFRDTAPELVPCTIGIGQPETS